MNREELQNVIKGLEDDLSGYRKELVLLDWNESKVKELIDQGSTIDVTEHYLGEGDSDEDTYRIDGIKVMGPYYEDLFEELETFAYHGLVDRTQTYKKEDGNYFGAGSTTTYRYSRKPDAKILKA